MYTNSHCNDQNIYKVCIKEMNMKDLWENTRWKKEIRFCPYILQQVIRVPKTEV